MGKQKRCLNCIDYKADDLDLKGNPLPGYTTTNSGVCGQTDERKMDGWSCGKWNDIGVK